MKYIFLSVFLFPITLFGQDLFFTVNPFGINRFEFINYSDTPNTIWDFGDGTYSDEYSPIHIFDSSKTYKVCLICDTVRYCKEVDISEPIDNLIRVYPVPVQSIVTVDLLSIEVDIDFVEIYCPEGIRIYLSKSINNKLFSLDLSDEENGWFTIIVWTKDVPRKQYITTFQK